ncbi:MAG: hypothetical protein A4E56_02938 [Pelotomaculum sp. PtaU1.Bin065]|nr:MAG: hypothetical protein A4E56_02938 [Pelotomaculum sp. PtaU1.Bin065]
MKIYVYTLVHDAGFAPNPYHGYCTLACCKPIIRKIAEVGDWIVGITPRAHGSRLVYAMNVNETLPFEKYWVDPRFIDKKPKWKSEDPVQRSGDNIYKYSGHAKFTQLPSRHWDSKCNQPDLNQMKIDLSGKYVLISKKYSYFGQNTQPIPANLLSIMRPARGHRVNFKPEHHQLILDYLESLPLGIHGYPQDFDKYRDKTCKSRKVKTRHSHIVC